MNKPKPEKKEIYKPTDEQFGDGAYYDLRERKGYNQCHDDFTAFLPSEGEILNIIYATTMSDFELSLIHI